MDEAADRARLLDGCVLFRAMAPEDRRELAARAHLRRYRAGASIVEAGSPGQAMMAIARGEVRISTLSSEGKEIVFAVLGAGDVFGEIAMLDGKERTADATAATACEILVLERRDVLAFLDRKPALYQSLVAELCGKLRRTSDQLAEIALLDLPGRIARLLLRLSRRDTGPPKQRLLLSQRELGLMVGGARESVNRCLALWQREGIVRIDAAAIIILDRAALEAIVDQG